MNSFNRVLSFLEDARILKNGLNFNFKINFKFLMKNDLNFIKFTLFCIVQAKQRNQPIFHQNETKDSSPDDTVKTICVTIAVNTLLIICIIGVFYGYKRFYGGRNHSASFHLNNSRSAMEESRIKMSKLTERITISSSRGSIDNSLNELNPE